jgi:hypothetical protein
MKFFTLIGRVRNTALPVLMLISVLASALVGAAGMKWN